MLRDVKVAIHDWPKRTMTHRDFVTVEADTDAEAFEKAKIAAKDRWPGGKHVPFDISKPYEKRPILKAKKP